MLPKIFSNKFCLLKRGEVKKLVMQERQQKEKRENDSNLKEVIGLKGEKKAFISSASFFLQP